MNEVEQAHADRDFWYEVRDLVNPDMELFGFSYRNSGSFRCPDLTIDGDVAAALIAQRDRIRRMIPMIDATDLPSDVEEYCMEHDYPLHYDSAVVQVYLGEENPLADWLRSKGHEFTPADEKRGWGHIGLVGS